MPYIQNIFVYLDACTAKDVHSIVDASCFVRNQARARKGDEKSKKNNLSRPYKDKDLERKNSRESH
jgi:hypothetical protein